MARYALTLALGVATLATAGDVKEISLVEGKNLRRVTLVEAETRLLIDLDHGHERTVCLIDDGGELAGRVEHKTKDFGNRRLHAKAFMTENRIHSLKDGSVVGTVPADSWVDNWDDQFYAVPTSAGREGAKLTAWNGSNGKQAWEVALPAVNGARWALRAQPDGVLAIGTIYQQQSKSWQTGLLLKVSRKGKVKSSLDMTKQVQESKEAFGSATFASASLKPREAMLLSNVTRKKATGLMIVFLKPKKKVFIPGAFQFAAYGSQDVLMFERNKTPYAVAIGRPAGWTGNEAEHDMIALDLKRNKPCPRVPGPVSDVTPTGYAEGGGKLYDLISGETTATLPEPREGAVGCGTLTHYVNWSPSGDVTILPYAGGEAKTTRFEAKEMRFWSAEARVDACGFRALTDSGIKVGYVTGESGEFTVVKEYPVETQAHVWGFRGYKGKFALVVATQGGGTELLYVTP